MVDIPDSPDSKIWLTIADEDFGFASVGLADKQTHYFPQICFHYQQAAEKYLKAFLVAHYNKLIWKK